MNRIVEAIFLAGSLLFTGVAAAAEPGDCGYYINIRCRGHAAAEASNALLAQPRDAGTVHAVTASTLTREGLAAITAGSRLTFADTKQEASRPQGVPSRLPDD